MTLKPCGRSWAVLKACFGGLGPLSGPMWAVLGRSRGVCGRSGDALGSPVGGLGASAAGPGLLLGSQWAILRCSWRP